MATMWWFQPTQHARTGKATSVLYCPSTTTTTSTTTHLYTLYIHRQRVQCGQPSIPGGGSYPHHAPCAEKSLGVCGRPGCPAAGAAGRFLGWQQPTVCHGVVYNTLGVYVVRSAMAQCHSTMLPSHSGYRAPHPPPGTPLPCTEWTTPSRFNLRSPPHRDPLGAPRHLPDASAAMMYNVAASQGPAVTNAAPPGTVAGGRASVAASSSSKAGQRGGSGSRRLPAVGTQSMGGR